MTWDRIGTESAIIFGWETKGFFKGEAFKSFEILESRCIDNESL
jgi:hypothetical protein